MAGSSDRSTFFFTGLISPACGSTTDRQYRFIRRASHIASGKTKKDPASAPGPSSEFPDMSPYRLGRLCLLTMWSQEAAGASSIGEFGRHTLGGPSQGPLATPISLRVHPSLRASPISTGPSSGGSRDHRTSRSRSRSRSLPRDHPCTDRPRRRRGSRPRIRHPRGRSRVAR